MASVSLAVSQNIDIDESNPTSRLMLHILAAVAEFGEMIQERVCVGVKNWPSEGQKAWPPKAVFNRQRAVELRQQGRSSSDCTRIGNWIGNCGAGHQRLRAFPKPPSNGLLQVLNAISPESAVLAFPKSGDFGTF